MKRIPSSMATLLFAISLVLSACTPSQLAPDSGGASTSAPTTAPTSAPEEEDAGEEATEAVDSLAGSAWVLESFGTPGAENPVVGEMPVTLEFTNDGQITGSGGCNSYNGAYQLEGNSLLLGEIVSTLIACVDTAVMDQEILYLDALQTVSEVALDGDHLTITYDEGQGVLNFVRADATPEQESPATATPAPEANAPSQPAPNQPAQSFLWNCMSCLGNQVWSFQGDQAERIEIPAEIDYFFGYAPQTGRILYSSPLPMAGGGPSMMAVHDLWTLDVASGESTPIFSEQTIIEAEWAADGEHLAYILATESTYELRWRALDGEDNLLASDVAFTFSVSPQGDKVAFTRESNYGLPGEPGLYVVDVATGEEVKIADADRAGAGSIDDEPVWQPSGQHILLPTYGTTAGPGLVRAAVDGSSTVTLGFDPALAGEEWYQADPVSPFWVNDTQFIAAASLGGSDAMMGGPLSLILYQLNDSLDTVVDGAVIGEGMLIGWHVPGQSVWVQVGDEMQIMALPAL